MRIKHTQGVGHLSKEAEVCKSNSRCYLYTWHSPHPSSRIINSLPPSRTLSNLASTSSTETILQKWTSNLKTSSIRLILLKVGAPEEFLLCLADSFIIQEAVEGTRASVPPLHNCRRHYSHCSLCDCCPLHLCSAQHTALEAAF